MLIYLGVVYVVITPEKSLWYLHRRCHRRVYVCNQKRSSLLPQCFIMSWDTTNKLERGHRTECVIGDWLVLVVHLFQLEPLRGHMMWEGTPSNQIVTWREKSWIFLPSRRKGWESSCWGLAEQICHYWLWDRTATAGWVTSVVEFSVQVGWWRETADDAVI